MYSWINNVFNKLNAVGNWDAYWGGGTGWFFGVAQGMTYVK